MVEIGKHFPLVFSMIVGIPSICSAVVLGLSYRKSRFAELILPAEALASLITYVVIFDAGLFSEIDLP